MIKNVEKGGKPHKRENVYRLDRFGYSWTVHFPLFVLWFVLVVELMPDLELPPVLQVPHQMQVVLYHLNDYRSLIAHRFRY